MQRCKELEHYIAEYRASWLNKKRAEIIGTKDTLLPLLADALDTLIQEQCRMQREGSQEKSSTSSSIPCSQVSTQEVWRQRRGKAWV